MTAEERKAYIEAKLAEARARIAAGLASGLASGLAAAAVALDPTSVDAPVPPAPVVPGMEGE